MSFLSGFVKSGSEAFFGNEYLRDYQHASKTFVANMYANAPKFKFLFHVYFDINPELNGSSFVPWDAKQNFGLNVKSVQLPKFTLDLHTMNQYNRKRLVQTKLKYDPVNLTLHDDNAGMARKLWQAYSSYYFKDMVQSGDINPTNKPNSTGTPNNIVTRNQYTDNIKGYDDWGYVGESATTTNKSKVSYFRAINIYGFNQHNFVLYRLINPMIESFSHDTYDYSQEGTMEHQMTLQYETVKYYEGQVDGRKPDAIVQLFGENAHYDTVKSPLARAGGQATLLGQGGLADAAGSIWDDLSSGDPMSLLRAAQTAGRTAKTFKGQNLTAMAKGEATGMLTSSAQGTANRNLPFQFPTINSTVNKK